MPFPLDHQPPGPVQIRFQDLYSAVYDLIDDAKQDRDLVKLHKGSHGSADPHPVVADVGSWLFTQRRGLLAFACHRVTGGDQAVPEHLDLHDAQLRPRLGLRGVFDLLARSTARRPGESERDFLTHLVSRRHELGVIAVAPAGMTARRGRSRPRTCASRAFRPCRRRY